MSLLVQVLAVLPAIAAVAFVLTALADHLEATALNDLRKLDVHAPKPTDVDRERTAA